MLSQIELTQLIATKLCHDLAGVLGAVNSGIEFLESDNDEMKAKALDLVQISSEQAINRLIFFRQTYGVAKYPGEANLDEIKKVAQDYLVGSKVTLNFHEKYFHIPDVFISTNLGKLILSIFQQAYLSLIHGGEVKIAVETSGQKNLITISAVGLSPKIDIEKHKIINGDMDDAQVTTSNCLTIFARLFAESIPVELSVDTNTENKIEYQIIF